MASPNRHNGGAQSLLLLAAVISLSFATKAPSLSSPSRKPAALHSDELTCEEKFKNAEKFTFNETSLHFEIRRLIDSYYNWGNLIADAPSAVTLLEKLIVMSYQPRMDFRRNSTDAFSGKYEFIKYLKNFQTTLLQVGHQGYLALLNAHVNIDKIRIIDSKMPSHIKDAVRYLMSRNDYYITNLLPITMGRIEEAVDGNKQLLHQVISKMMTVIELIQEIIFWVVDTKNNNEKELERVGLDLKSLSGRRKTRQDVERTRALNVAKKTYAETIQALREGLIELGILRTDWTKLIDFYSRLTIFIDTARKNSKSLIEFLKVTARDLNVLDDDEIFQHLLDQIQKVNEASFLVYGVSDMYVNVSIEHIMDRIASSHDITTTITSSTIDSEGILKELKMSDESASNRILSYVQSDETSLREKLVDRHNQILNEYQWMTDCSSPEDREFKRN